jgi:hypothetical protein
MDVSTRLFRTQTLCSYENSHEGFERRRQTFIEGMEAAVNTQTSFFDPVERKKRKDAFFSKKGYQAPPSPAPLHFAHRFVSKEYQLAHSRLPHREVEPSVQVVPTEVLHTESDS